MIRVCLLLTSLLSSLIYAAPAKILFGSCSHQDKAMPIFSAINQEQADLFVFLGDNVYGDTENMDDLAAKYQRLGKISGFKALKKSTPMIAIWDDHDFGENDAGMEYPHKEASRQIMLDFWQAPKNSARRTRQDGIYTSYFYGDENKNGERSRSVNKASKNSQSIQIIMPDLRWNRPSLNSVGKEGYITERAPKKMGPYSPSEIPNESMLGEQQWRWLESELLKPASIKVIASSLQLLPEFTGWESWANFPADRERLLNFIKKNKINGVIIISGDTHWGEISKVTEGLDYPLWEVTSSGLTEEWKDVSPNIHRVEGYTHAVNYGHVTIDWQQKDPLITFGLKNVEGNVVMQRKFALSSISPY